MHPLDVPGHSNQAPLATDAIEPAQQELSETHHRFDDAEYRLRGLFAQTVELFALRCRQRQAMASTAVGFSAPEAARQTVRARRDDAAAARALLSSPRRELI